MKLLLPDVVDCLKIQSYLNRLAEWREANALDKCKSITFSRLRHPIEFSYMLGGIIVLTLSMTSDLRSNKGQQDVFYWAY
jgi:hypothetical protein